VCNLGICGGPTPEPTSTLCNTVHC
jgi:hypothetical protein